MTNQISKNTGDSMQIRQKILADLNNQETQRDEFPVAGQTDVKRSRKSW